MCSTTKIGIFVTTASLAIIGAVIALAVAAVSAETFWGAFGNSVPVGIAAGLVAVALTAVNGAAAYVTSFCRAGSCKASGDALFSFLFACGIALSVLLAAVIVGIFATSIPWAGGVVAIALGVAAVACGVSLAGVVGYMLALDMCQLGPRAPTTPAVTVAMCVAVLAVIGLLAVALAAGELPPGPIPGG